MFWPFSRSLLPPSRQQVVSPSQSSCVSSVELRGEGGAKPQTPRKSFNTLCLQPEEIEERWLNSFKIRRSPSENYTCHRACQCSGGERCLKYIFFSLHHSTELCTGTSYRTIQDQSHARDIKSDFPKCWKPTVYLGLFNFYITLGSF